MIEKARRKEILARGKLEITWPGEPPTLHPTMTDEENEYLCAVLIETVEHIREEG